MRKSNSGDVYTMNFKKTLIILSLFVPSICLAANSYDQYKETVTNCIDIEKNKAPLAAHDLDGLKPEDVEKYLFLIKDIRIQQCSSQEEMKALVDELAASDKPVDAKDLGYRYLSIYNNRRISELSDVEKEKLNQIDASLRGKSLEVNLLDLREKLKDN